MPLVHFFKKKFFHRKKSIIKIHKIVKYDWTEQKDFVLKQLFAMF